MTPDNDAVNPRAPMAAGTSSAAVSVQILTPLAVFFVILALTVVGMVAKLLRHLAQLQPDAAVRRSGSYICPLRRLRPSSATNGSQVTTD